MTDRTARFAAALLALGLAVALGAPPAAAQPTSSSLRSVLLQGPLPAAEAFAASSPARALPGETASSQPALDQARRDPWLGFDKLQHVAFSALWTLSTQYVLEANLDLREPRALPLSVASAAAIGLGKELYDHRAPGRWFSTRDLVADAVGIGLGVLVIAL